MASAVLFDRQPFDRMVRCRTVAKVLSMALVQMTVPDRLHWRAELAEVVDGQAEGDSGSGALPGLAAPIEPRGNIA